MEVSIDGGPMSLEALLTTGNVAQVTGMVGDDITIPSTQVSLGFTKYNSAET